MCPVECHGWLALTFNECMKYLIVVHQHISNILNLDVTLLGERIYSQGIVLDLDVTLLGEHIYSQGIAAPYVYNEKAYLQ